MNNKLRMLSKNNIITKKKTTKKKNVVNEDSFCNMPSIDESLLLLKNILATKRTVKRNVQKINVPKKEPHTYLKASSHSKITKKKESIKNKKKVILINGHVLNRKKN